MVKGKVSDINGKVIPDAIVDVWQSGPDGLYDVQENNVVDLRGKMSTNKNGEYSFKTVKPQFIGTYNGPVGEINLMGSILSGQRIYIL